MLIYVELSNITLSNTDKYLEKEDVVMFKGYSW
jgi:hypothetical protein